MKKTMGVICMVASLGLGGCGSGTEVNGSVNGHELEAADAIFLEEGTETTPVRRVVIADEGDLCDVLRSGERPEEMTSLEIRIVGLAGEDAEFPVGGGEAPYAEAEFAKEDDAQSLARADSGKVVTDASDEDTLEAEFDLDFGEAGSLDGTVEAARCDL